MKKIKTGIMPEKKNKKIKSLKDLDYEVMRKDLKKPALLICGMAVGNWGINKLNEMADKESGVNGLLGASKESKENLKKYIIPGLGVAAGLVMHQVWEDENRQFFALGVSTLPGLKLAGNILGKDILNLKILEPGEKNNDPENNQNPAVSGTEESTLQLMPLHELEEPTSEYTGSYIDSVMQNIQAEPQEQFIPEPITRQEPAPEEIEVNLESNRPEDNFETQRPPAPAPEENVSGSLEAIILEPEPFNYEREYEEELDFTNIP